MSAMNSSRNAAAVRCAALAAASILCSTGAALAQSPAQRNPCAIYGSGYVAVQGTDGCARIGGRVRLEPGVSAAQAGDELATPRTGAALPPGPVTEGARRVHLRVQQAPSNSFEAPRTR